MALQQIGPDSLKDSLRTFEFTSQVAGPTSATYTITSSVLNPFKILAVYYSNDVSSGTDNTTFGLKKNGVAMTGDFSPLTTVNGSVTFKDATAPNLAENSFAVGDTFEYTIGTLGANVDFITLTFHAELL